MVLLFQQNFQEHKLVRQELTKVYGINKFLAHQICDSLGFALTLKVQDLTAENRMTFSPARSSLFEAVFLHLSGTSFFVSFGP